MRTMYDSATAAHLPSDGDLYAAYVNGLYANVSAVQQRFPGKRVVTIAVTSQADADVLDVEPGDATPATAVPWVIRQRKRGADPTVYCMASQWSAVRAAFHQAGVAEPHYWIAQYDNNPTLMAGAVAKQYGGDQPGNYDISVVADHWPGIDPPEEDLTSDQDQRLTDIKNLLVTLVQGAPGFGVDPIGVDTTKDHALLLKIADKLGVPTT